MVSTGTTKAERIGFIGVGLMGHGMAKNIVEKGYPLTVMGHRNREPVEDLLGARRQRGEDRRATSPRRPTSSSSASPARPRSRRSCAARTA